MTVERPSLRLCFVGDSFVHGTGDPDGWGWAGRLVRQERRRGVDVTPYNLGIRGETSRDIEARWIREVEPRLASVSRTGVIFSFGVNDACLSEETEEPRVKMPDTLQASERLLSEARSRYRVLMIGPPPIAEADVNARVIKIDEGMAALCRRINVPYLSVFAPLRADAEWMREATRGDGAHPAEEGYGRLAKLVAEWGPWRDLIDGSPSLTGRAP